MLHALALALAPAAAPAPTQVASELQVAWSVDVPTVFGEQLTPDGGVAFLQSNVAGGPATLDSYTADGQLRWSVSVPMAAADLTVHADGRATVLGIISATASGFPAPPVAAGDDFGLVHYDGNGNELSRARLGGPFDDLYGIVGADGAGGVFIAGATRRDDLGPPFQPLGVAKVFVARVDAADLVTWETTLLGQFPNQDDFQLASAAFHPTSGVVVSAVRRDAFSTSTPDRFGLWRFEPDGTQVYYDGFFDSALSRMTLDAQGGVFASYAFYDPSISFTFDGVTYVEPSGATRWRGDMGMCDHAAAGIDSQGRLWAVVNEPVLGCPPFGTLGPRQLVSFSPSSGAGGDRIELSPLQRTVSIGPLDRVLGRRIDFPSATSTVDRLGSLEEPWITVCAGATNSTGAEGELAYVGSDSLLDNDALLAASSLPPGRTTLFLTAFANSFVANPGGSDGDLCLGAPIGRFAAPSQLRTSTADGRAALAVDLLDLPVPPGHVPATAGQRLFFQAWYRDANPAPTSNFTSTVGVFLR